MRRTACAPAERLVRDALVGDVAPCKLVLISLPAIVHDGQVVSPIESVAVWPRLSAQHVSQENVFGVETLLRFVLPQTICRNV